jgi:hypothetical protein
LTERDLAILAIDPGATSGWAVALVQGGTDFAWLGYGQCRQRELPGQVAPHIFHDEELQWMIVLERGFVNALNPDTSITFAETCGWLLAHSELAITRGRATPTPQAWRPAPRSWRSLTTQVYSPTPAAKRASVDFSIASGVSLGRTKVDAHEAACMAIAGGRWYLDPTTKGCRQYVPKRKRKKS